MNKLKDLIENITLKRIIVSATGGFIIGIGLMFLSLTGLGADAPTVFREGTALAFNTTQGVINIILGIIMVLITLYVDHKQLGIGTIFNIFTVSWGMDLTKVLFDNISINPYLLYIIGLVVLAIGVGMTFAAKLGASYYDAFCAMGGNLIKKSYSIFRYPLDAVLLLIGYLNHGTVGIGTIICLFFIGPIIDLAIKMGNIVFKDL